MTENEFKERYIGDDHLKKVCNWLLEDSELLADFIEAGMNATKKKLQWEFRQEKIGGCDGNLTFHFLCPFDSDEAWDLCTVEFDIDLGRHSPVEIRHIHKGIIHTVELLKFEDSCILKDKPHCGEAMVLIRKRLKTAEVFQRKLR